MAVYLPKKTESPIGSLDDIFSEIFGSSNSKSGYPPYNIYTTGENNQYCTAEFAVAGFSKDEINVEFSGRILKVEGKKSVETTDEKRNYHVRLLAQRSFSKVIDLVKIYKLISANLNGGILTLKFEQETTLNKIEITE